MRKAEPLKLCFKSGAWYVYGYCLSQTDFRFFKLRRMKQLQVNNETFQRPSPKKVFLKETSFQETFVKLRLKLSAEMACRVYDEFDSYQQQEDGSFMAEIMYPRQNRLVLIWLTKQVGFSGV